MTNYREILGFIYEKFNPGKMHEIDLLLNKYAGQEKELLEAVINKYGIDPLQQAKLMAGENPFAKQVIPLTEPEPEPQFQELTTEEIQTFPEEKTETFSSATTPPPYQPLEHIPDNNPAPKKPKTWLWILLAGCAVLIIVLTLHFTKVVEIPFLNALFGGSAKTEAPASDSTKTEDYSMSFEGSLGKAGSVVMFLDFSNDKVSGEYFYKSIGTIMTLDGTLKDGKLEMTESNPDGVEVATFSGTIDESGSFSGTWTKLNGNKTIDFRLKNIFDSRATIGIRDPETELADEYNGTITDPESEEEDEADAESDLKIVISGIEGNRITEASFSDEELEDYPLTGCFEIMDTVCENYEGENCKMYRVLLFQDGEDEGAGYFDLKLIAEDGEIQLRGSWTEYKSGNKKTIELTQGVKEEDENELEEGEYLVVAAMSADAASLQPLMDEVEKADIGTDASIEETNDFDGLQPDYYFLCAGENISRKSAEKIVKKLQEVDIQASVRKASRR